MMTVTVHIPMMITAHITMMITVHIPMMISAHTNDDGNSAHTFHVAPLFLQTRCHLVSC